MALVATVNGPTSYTVHNDANQNIIFHLANLSGATDISFLASHDEQETFIPHVVWDIGNSANVTSVTGLTNPGGLYSMNIVGVFQIRFDVTTITSVVINLRFHDNTDAHLYHVYNI